MFSKGYWTVVRLRSVPVRVHWSVPIGGLVLTGFAFAPGAWAGYALLVLTHELGHAALVRRLGYEPLAVRMHGLGGDCTYVGDPTRADVAAIAWGGVLAQGALGLVAALVVLLVGVPHAGFLGGFVHTLLWTNAELALINLIPAAPLDGYWAWQLFGIWWTARRELREYQAQRQARARRIDARPTPAAVVRAPEVASCPAVGAGRRADARATEATAPAPEEEAVLPMPVEVEETLARILDEVRREQRAKRRGDP